jgi:F0F1-type ATP synthase membrane subunit c/vacuolar-type H+-ATPase subunit K
MMMDDKELEKGLRPLLIIWFAMLMSLAVYVFIGLQVAGSLGIALDSETRGTLKAVLYLLAFVTLIATRYVRRFLLSARVGGVPVVQNDASPVRPTPIGKYAVAMIVAWAMSESIGIYGLVLFFLGKNPMDLYLLISVAAAAIFTYRPRKDELVNLSVPGFESTPGGLG